MSLREGKRAEGTGAPSRGPGADVDLGAAILAVHRELELAGQIRILLELAAAWTGATFGIGYAPGPDGRSLAPVVSTAAEDDPRRLSFVPAPRQRVEAWAPAGPALADARTILAGAAPDWPAAVPSSLLAAVLHGTTDGTSGALLLTLDAAPQPRRIEQVAALVEAARPALENGLRVAALRELVIKDDTAHCFNRRYFEEFLPEELARASRFRSALSLIFLDMDNLKQVNNRYGHASGSRVLREVATRVRGRIRKFDKLFRFGGDEFCIVLPETAWHGALEVAERVRDAIFAKPFLAGDVEGGRGVPMSASLGIASFPLHARTQPELIERADRAMQRVKGTGKNAIGVAAIEGAENGA